MERKTPFRAALLAAAVLLALPVAAVAQDTADYFKSTCASCHTIGGGRLAGPDLKNVHDRRDREWLIQFIVDPARKLDGGDPIAAQLLAESNNVRMPNQPGMTRARAEALLDLIVEESALEQSRFKGVQLSDRPFTPLDVERGRELFLGRASLAAAGPACIACHTVGGIGGLGGGRLGPDLTRALERYTDRKVLGAWLSAPATPTMGAVFADHALTADEILPLVAYLSDAAANESEDPGTGRLVFLLLGAGGAGAAMSILARMFRNRFRAVRRPLVAGEWRRS